jgi:hypothetical protein
VFSKKFYLIPTINIPLVFLERDGADEIRVRQGNTGGVVGVGLALRARRAVAKPSAMAAVQILCADGSSIRPYRSLEGRRPRRPPHGRGVRV